MCLAWQRVTGNMNELHIKQAKAALQTLPILTLCIFISFVVALYIKTGLSSLTVAILMSTILMTAYGIWDLHTTSKRQVSINRLKGRITVLSVTIFGHQRIRHYPIQYFSAVRSYITTDNAAKNMVELVTNDGKRGLLLSSFSSNGKKRWPLDGETENPDAAALVNVVTAFIPLKNLGFVGKRFETDSVEKEKRNFFSKLF
jgi:uncharacterized membrane protein